LGYLQAVVDHPEDGAERKGAVGVEGGGLGQLGGEKKLVFVEVGGVVEVAEVGHVVEESVKACGHYGEEEVLDGDAFVNLFFGSGGVVGFGDVCCGRVKLLDKTGRY